MRNLRFSLVLAALGAALSASAAQILHTFAVDSTTGFDSLTYDAFSPALGTLTSVVITLDIRSTGSVSVTNRGAAVAEAVLFSYSYGELDLFRPSLASPGDDELMLFNYGEFSEDRSGPLATGESLTATLDFAGGVNAGGYRVSGNQFGTNATGTYTGAALTMFYARSAGEQNKANIYLGAYGGFSGLNHATYTYDYDGTMTGSIAYNYAPVPEPSALVALGLGALALGRRRARRA